MIDLKAFTNSIWQSLYDNFPQDTKSYPINKWKGRNGRKVREVAMATFDISSVGANKYVFDIGNENAEKLFPHYHILEDAQVIHKRGRGTKTSKGSQASYPSGMRDYGKVIYKPSKSGGYSVYREYRKNVRGKRSQLSQTMKADSNVYANVYYRYIEKTLEKELPIISTTYGLKAKRVSIDESPSANEVSPMDMLESMLSFDNGFAD